MTKRKSTRYIGFRVTEEEWKAFDQQMKKWEISKTTYIKALITGVVITGCQPAEVMEAIKVLQDISVHILEMSTTAKIDGKIDFFLFLDYFQQIQNCCSKIIHANMKTVNIEEEIFEPLLSKYVKVKDLEEYG